MSTEEKPPKPAADYDEEESEDEHEQGQDVDDEPEQEFPQIDIDPTQLTPLSPEVISKQVRLKAV